MSSSITAAGERPVLSSEPTLFYDEDDLYQEWAGKRSTVTREVVGMRRNAMELEKVVALAAQAHAEGRTIAGLTDGTLILWMLEGKPYDFRREILKTTLASLQRAARIARAHCGLYFRSRQCGCAQCPARGPVSGTAAQLRPGARGKPPKRSISSILMPMPNRPRPFPANPLPA